MTERWRRYALLLLLLGLAGTGAELVLLEHFEDAPQWIPIALLGGGVLVGGVLAVRPTRAVVRTMQVLMMVYIPAAFVGLYLHLNANREFALELRPSTAGSELAVEMFTGAIPALVPGAMAWLGLLGLLVCWRHPSLGGHAPADTQPRAGEPHHA